MTEQDMELTRLAAKAAGIELEPGTTRIAGTMQTWRPLTHDGDAFRLYVTLEMMVDSIKKGYMEGHDVAIAGSSISDSCHAYEPRDSDPYTATRRAIVRAAAAIGKVMNEAKGTV